VGCAVRLYRAGWAATLLKGGEGMAVAPGEARANGLCVPSGVAEAVKGLWTGGAPKGLLVGSAAAWGAVGKGLFVAGVTVVDELRVSLGGRVDLASPAVLDERREPALSLPGHAAVLESNFFVGFFRSNEVMLAILARSSSISFVRFALASSS